MPMSQTGYDAFGTARTEMRAKDMVSLGVESYGLKCFVA